MTNPIRKRATPKPYAQLHVEIYEAVIAVANRLRRPAAVKEISVEVRCTVHTARRHLRALVEEGELFCAPILPGMPLARQHHPGYLPADESRTGGRCLCECAWPGCPKAPVIMKRHPGTGDMAGWCSQHMTGFADEEAEREHLRRQMFQRHSSAQSCGGWAPPDRGDD